MKNKLCFCKKCNKKTIHHVEYDDATYSITIGICTGGLFIPRDLRYTCLLCGNEFINREDKTCWFL